MERVEKQIIICLLPHNYDKRKVEKKNCKNIYWKKCIICILPTRIWEEVSNLILEYDMLRSVREKLSTGEGTPTGHNNAPSATGFWTQGLVAVW